MNKDIFIKAISTSLFLFIFVVWIILGGHSALRLLDGNWMWGIGFVVWLYISSLFAEINNQ